MRLSICIPTHNGRRETLRTLLDSILAQRNIADDDALEICISDNASADQTSQLIQEYQRVSPFPIKYFRFAVDVGVRNFANVVEMASFEWCWLVGSDDVLLPNAVEAVSEALRAYPGVGGITVGKVNMDSTLSEFKSEDHNLALPARPLETRIMTDVGELALPFAYMSAHLFRRDDWRRVVQAYGIEYVESLRHFPHAFIFSQIAAREPWLWLGKHLVLQRLDNSCVMEALDQQKHRYATQVTEDLIAVAVAAYGAPRRDLLRRLFMIYWNPWLVVRYRACLSAEEDRAIRTQCFRWFRLTPLFWVTSAPILVLPRSIPHFFLAWLCGIEIPRSIRRTGSWAVHRTLA